MSYSQAVAASGNALSVDMTVFNNSTPGDISVSVEGSNDLENWVVIESDIVTVSTVLGQGAATYYYDTVGGAPQRVAFAYVRLAYRASEGDAVVAAGVNFFSA
ncbi:MAG: hypothetical protein R3F20_13990 [Planctomycetota bacterium]